MVPPGPSPSPPHRRLVLGETRSCCCEAWQRWRGKRERERGMGGEPAEQWPGWVCGLRPKRSELTLSCHQTFQSPAWEPEEKIREPNTYCFFCSRCQVWWDELAICSPSYDLAKPETSAFRVATFHQSQTKAEGWGEGGGYLPHPPAPAPVPAARLTPRRSGPCPSPPCALSLRHRDPSVSWEDTLCPQLTQPASLSLRSPERQARVEGACRAPHILWL